MDNYLFASPVAARNCVMDYHLAQVNIARLQAKPDDPRMAGLITRIDEMNLLAEQSRGFVWRLRGPEATPAALRVFEDYLMPFEPERVFYNLSVWESVEDLKRYAFRTQHAEMLRDKHQWKAHFDRAYLALWWMPAGQMPTIVESAERLRSVHEHGPTAHAFTMRESYPKPVA
jgi:hypothetical protein